MSPHQSMLSGSPPSVAEAQRWCRRLAKSHYENFTVASWLLPKELRQHFTNVYAYCRVADDLADETGDPAESLRLLDEWEMQLRECYRGHAQHPVFVALSETIREFDIPPTPFADLLVAFRRDQTPARFATCDELLQYCRYSANPVGRLVLYLGQCHDEETGRMADAICTGLQLVNFWQDVARDRARGRVYIPTERLQQFGVTEANLDDAQATSKFRALLAQLVDWAESFFDAGRPLLARVPRDLQVEVELFWQGGMAVCEAIRKQDYDVLRRRPRLSKGKKLRLFFAAWWRVKRLPFRPASNL